MFLKDQPYGVVIEPLICGSVDAVRQHCPAKRLTPMGLVAGESARCFANFIDEIGYFGMYFEWKCGYYRKRLREDFMILGGISVIFRSEFIWECGKNMQTSP